MSEKRPASPSALFRNSVLSSLQERTTSTHEMPRDDPAENSSNLPAMKRSRSIRSDASSQPSQLRCRPMPESSGMAASQLFARPLVRGRSSLFGSLTAKSRSRVDKSASEFPQKLSQDPTLLDDDFQSTTLPDESSNSFQQPNKKGSSLFGAVMLQFGSTVASKVPSTPTRVHSTNSDSAAGLMSPSGNAIMNIVNKFVMNSPFRFQSPKARRRALSTSSSSSVATPSPRKRRRLDMDAMDSRSSLHDDENWLEAPIQNQQVEIRDWSLKTKLRLECHPPSCLPVVTANRDWMETLRYWEYSVDALLPLNKQGSIQASQNTGKKGSKEDPPSAVDQTVDGTCPDLATTLIRSVKGPNAPFSRPNKERDASSQTRQGEWQEALRSLFLNWCRTVENLGAENVDEAILDCYCYCMAEDHLVLFRVDATAESPYYAPRVLISSCSDQFQDELKKTGVSQITYLDDGTPQNAPPGKQSDLPMSPTVKADLEALRRAQAYGHVAGADVSIKFQTKKTSQPASLSTQQQMAPVTVSGFDDVWCFFEVYLNSFGRVKTDASEALPTLVCRGLGPFLHSSMKSLKVYPVKHQKGAEGNDSGAVEIEGMILPCTIRKLVGSSAARLTSFVEQQSPKKKVVPLAIRSPLKDDNAGSHYIVLHSIAESGNSLGANDSHLFNGLKDNTDSSSTSSQVLECRQGSGLQLVVWDISRKQVVACKVEGGSRANILSELGCSDSMQAN
jgi:hypothetical protein